MKTNTEHLGVYVKYEMPAFFLYSFTLYIIQGIF